MHNCHRAARLSSSSDPCTFSPLGSGAWNSATISGTQMHQRPIVPFDKQGIFYVVFPSCSPLSASRDPMISKVRRAEEGVAGSQNERPTEERG